MAPSEVGDVIGGFRSGIGCVEIGSPLGSSSAVAGAGLGAIVLCLDVVAEGVDDSC